MGCNFINLKVNYLQTLSKLQDRIISFLERHAILIPTWRRDNVFKMATPLYYKHIMVLNDSSGVISK
jgi:hypothetical protein